MQLDGARRRRLRRLWQGESTTEEIASELGLTEGEIASVAAVLGLPERTISEVYLPSAMEIRLATAEIRSRWTQSEREARLGAAWSARINNTGGQYARDSRGPPHDVSGRDTDRTPP
jgi:hypothetical protein